VLSKYLEFFLKICAIRNDLTDAGDLLPDKYRLTGKILSWVVLCLGMAIGLVAFVLTIQAPIEADPNSYLWLESRFEVAGVGLLGLLFLVGSFAALRNRRRSGLLFVAGSPIVAFILAYPLARFWVPATSGAYYKLPDLAPAMVLAGIFFAPFYAPLVVIRKRKRATYLFLGFAALFGLAVTIWEKTSVLLLPLGGWWGLFLIFAAFWFGTYKLGWPPILASEPGPLSRRMATILIESVSVTLLVLAGTFGSVALRARPEWAGDCSGPALFSRPLRADHMVFTASLIRVAHVRKVLGRWAGPWAIGWVEKRYWGLPSWMPRLVFIANGRFSEGEIFFISGLRAEGWLARFLPIVSTQPCFGAAGRLEETEIYRRLIGKTPHGNQVFLIGNVYSPKRFSETPKQPVKQDDPNEIYDLVLNRPPRFTPLVGARVSVTGSSGTTVVTTDEKGIYEVSLTPGDYTLRPVDLPANLIAVELKLNKKDFTRGGPFQSNFFLEWDGTIEGTVRDTNGHPAQVSVELQPPDKTELGSSYTGSLLPPRDKSGTFRFEHLPPGGRYIVMVNPFGPYRDSPFAPIYYPAAVSPENARVLEIKPEASRVNADLIVHRLEERKLSVRVAWPNGQTIDDASVLVAYEHTKYWNDPSRTGQSWNTDRKGVAEIQVFGDYRVRVLAEKFMTEKNSPPWGAPRYSPVVELETAKLPRSLNLIVSSTKLAH